MAELIYTEKSVPKIYGENIDCKTVLKDQMLWKWF